MERQLHRQPPGRPDPLGWRAVALRELDDATVAVRQARAAGGPTGPLDAALVHLAAACRALAPPDELSLVWRCDVTDGPGGSRQVRAGLREACRQWQLSVALTSAVVDVASELATNAVQHGRPPFELVVRADASGLLVAMRDASPVVPRVLPYRVGLSEHGLGLRLVMRLATRWGADPDDGGKVVWASLLRG